MSDASQSSPYATFVQRSAAAIIDLALCAAVGTGAGVLLVALLGLSAAVRTFVVYLAVLGTGWAYCSSLESSRRQATFGKHLLGIVVTDSDGNRLTFPAASLRYFAKTVSALPLMAGFVLAAFTPRRQALHDLLGGCAVLTREAAAAATRKAVRAAAPSAPPAALTPPRPTVAAAVPPVSHTQPATSPPAPFAPRATPPPAPVRLMSVDESAAPAPRQGAIRQEAEAGAEHTVLINAAYAPTMMMKPRLGWVLVAMSGPEAGRTYELGWEARIGREPDNTIRLADDNASRHHAKIVQRPDGYVVSDLNSSNGTLIDGERIGEPRLLRPGAEITIGNTRLVLRTPDTTH